MSYNDELDFLCEIYDLNELHLGIVKETMCINHAYQTIGVPEILTEGFSDILGKMGDFFKKMGEKIKEFFRKFFMIINGYFMEIDKFVKKYKPELDKVKGLDFTIQGYKFTIGEKPNLEPFQDLVNSYNEALSEINKLKSNEIKKESNAMLSDTNLDKIRAKVLGVSTPISAEDFTDTIRKTYRNGDDSTIEITVDDAMYRNTISDVESLVKEKKDAEKLRDQLLVLFNKTENFFEKKVSTVYVNKDKKIATQKLNVKDNQLSKEDEQYSNYSDSTYTVFNEFIRYKYNYCRKIASITNLVATEYCNAYKDQIKMSKEIIMKGLQEKSSSDKDSANGEG